MPVEGSASTRNQFQPPSFPTFRVFTASGLIHENCDVVTVQRALGHKSPTVTLNTYAHLWPNANERTRKAAANLFQSAVKPAADGLRTESR
ncbi:tyrosine-type recombinase/integrase [Mycolicibacterium farcinogenes]|nr:tyrosine-type recombinase/integrase [Mycolicibacterium farcinogenes]